MDSSKKNYFTQLDSLCKKKDKEFLEEETKQKSFFHQIDQIDNSIVNNSKIQIKKEEL